MSYDPYGFDPGLTYGSQETVGQFTARTFLWMVLGLAVTFGVAVGSWFTGFTFWSLSAIPWIHVIALVATLAISLTMATRIERMRVGTAIACFVVFSVLFGFTLSMYLLLFDLATMVLVFAATAVYFAVLAAYGWFTKRDLSGLRPILMSGLIFLIVYGLLSLFILRLSMFDTAVCVVGIAVFLGFTAYDTQKIRAMYQYYSGFPEMLAKASIFSALQLYLDFLNLFLYLLRFIGNRKN